MASSACCTDVALEMNTDSHRVSRGCHCQEASTAGCIGKSQAPWAPGAGVDEPGYSRVCVCVCVCVRVCLGAGDPRARHAPSTVHSWDYDYGVRAAPRLPTVCRSAQRTTVLLTHGARPAQFNCCPAVDTDLIKKWAKQWKGCSSLGEVSVRDDV